MEQKDEKKYIFVNLVDRCADVGMGWNGMGSFFDEYFLMINRYMTMNCYIIAII